LAKKTRHVSPRRQTDVEDRQARAPILSAAASIVSVSALIANRAMPR
jgi:hypothetical protein